MFYSCKRLTSDFLEAQKFKLHELVLDIYQREAS